MSIQAQVINLLEDLQDEFDLTYVVIAHDLSVVRHMSDRVAVMYLGKLVEVADRDELYTAPDAPLHDGAAVGRAGARHERGAPSASGSASQGDVPSPINPPPACRFHTRCWKAQDICRTASPRWSSWPPATRSPATSPRTPRRAPRPPAAGPVRLDTPRPREDDATA